MNSIRTVPLDKRRKVVALEPFDRLGGSACPGISPGAGEKSPQSAQQHGSSSGDESFEKLHSLPPILPTNTGANVLER
jgi:hypothetical protein